MAENPNGPCIAAFPPVRKFLKNFRCRLTGADVIEETVRDIASARGEDWPWVAKWAAEEGPQWVNDRETLVFEIPLETLVGAGALDFTQQVWMLQPSLFEYRVSRVGRPRLRPGVLGW